MTDPAALLTLSEAAQRLRVSVRTLEREARDSRLAIIRIRSIRLVSPDELERYLAAAQDAGRQSVTSARVGRDALVSADVLNALFRQRPPEQPTRGRSKLRSAARRSTLRDLLSTPQVEHGKKKAA